MGEKGQLLTRTTATGFFLPFGIAGKLHYSN